MLALILSLPVILSPLTTPTPTWPWILLFVADIALIVLLLFRLEPSLLGISMGLVGILLVSIDAVVASQIFAATPPITDENGNPIPGSIATLEKVNLSGTEQWISIQSPN